jgi:hypothetical protein
MLNCHPPHAHNLLLLQYSRGSELDNTPENVSTAGTVGMAWAVNGESRSLQQNEAEPGFLLPPEEGLD